MGRSPRMLILTAVVVLLACALAPIPSVAQQTSNIDETFVRVHELQGQGEYDEAIRLLSDLIREHSQSEQVLRKAYNDLVFTYLSKLGTVDVAEQDSLNAKLIENARAAITRFPDLDAPAAEYPPEVNRTYRVLREVMFGRVEVTSSVDSSRVFLRPKGDEGADTYQGITPLAIPYVPVGDYLLTVTRSGYQDRIMPLTVEPNVALRTEVALSKERTKKWWLTRVVAPVTAGVAAVVAIVIGTQDNSTPEPTQPLAGPPPPPAGQ
jgi:PEGA domain